MTTITAKVVEHSISPERIELTTLLLRYPKCIHGEAKTHRQVRIGDRAYELLEEVGFMDDPNLSRNASSSRAIPVERLIKDVMDDPYIPIHWGKNQKGMQALEECDALIKLSEFVPDSYWGEATTNEKTWLFARDFMIEIARAFHQAGYHKQIINRLLEPWAHINVVVTATEWSNFFALRDHADAMPEIQALARAMKVAMAASTPQILKPGEWHTPFTNVFKEGSGIPSPQTWETAIKLSVARCARTSYLTQEGKTPKLEEDLALYDRLVGGDPLHASPCEHQATPDIPYEASMLINNQSVRKRNGWNKEHLHGNLKGWVQYRKTLPGECK